MKSELLLLAILAVEHGAIAMCCWNPKWLHGTVIVNMLLISLFAGKMVSMFGFVSNVGNVLYATACVAQLVTLQRQERADAALNTVRALVSMGLVLAVVQLMIAIPSTAGNEAVSTAMQIVLATGPNAIVASFLAFVAAQAALVLVWTRLPNWHVVPRYVAAAIACQAVDSAIFFPIAFPDLSTGDLARIGSVGFAAKVLVMLSFLPYVWQSNVTVSGVELPHQSQA